MARGESIKNVATAFPEHSSGKSHGIHAAPVDATTRLYIENRRHRPPLRSKNEAVRNAG